MQSSLKSRINPFLALSFTLSGTIIGVYAARAYLGPIIPAIQKIRSTNLYAVKQIQADVITAEDISNIDTIDTVL